MGEGVRKYLRMSRKSGSEPTVEETVDVGRTTLVQPTGRRHKGFMGHEGGRVEEIGRISGRTMDEDPHSRYSCFLEPDGTPRHRNRGSCDKPR